MLRKIKKVISSKYTLFFLILLLLILKFFGLFQGGILPSWDGSVNYYGVEKMVKSYLPQLKFSGYDMNWFGGVPLFSLYPPLAFILPGLIYYLLFGVVDLSIIFKTLIFLQLFLIPVVFYLFAKEYFNKKTAKFSTIFSLFLIFYCYRNSHDGFMGAKSSIFTGLFASGFGLILFILFFTFLEKLRKNPNNKKNLLLVIFTASALILTHALSTLAAGILLILYLAFHHKKKFIKKFLVVGIISLLLCAFYLIPFLSQLKYSSAAPFRLEQSAFHSFFPFRVEKILEGNLVSILAFLIFLFFIIGTIKLFKKQKFFLPVSFLIIFILVFGDFFPSNFPNLPFHYPRFIQFFAAIEIIIASYGFVYFLKKINNKTLVYISITIILSLFLYQVLIYGSGIQVPSNKHQQEQFNYYHYNFKDYPAAKQGQEIVNYFKNKNVKTRVFAESPPYHVEKLGSPHYFDTFLPKNKISTINGLWTESSVQNPFVMGIITVLSNNISWGYKPLNKLTSFKNLTDAEMIDRLKKFNVEYIIASTLQLKQTLDNYQKAAPVKEISGFKIYRLENFNKKVEYAHFKPGLFVEGGLKFREFSLWWYIQSELLDFPVVQAKKTNLSKFTKEELNKFSCLITSKDPTKNNRQRIEKQIPIVQIKKEDIQDSIYTNKKGGEKVLKELTLIKEKSRIKFNKNIDLKNSDWLYKEYNNINPNSLKVLTFNDEEIELSGVGPIIINAGFFPYWRRKDGKPVYQVTPGQILVFADSQNDKITLEYKANLIKKISVIISYLTLIGIIIWWLQSDKNKNILK